MRKVIGVGETVLDIIFKKEKPVSAVPGGSTFNAIVSLGRSGVPTTFISEAGNDRVGDFVINFLKQNNINADNVNKFPDSKTPLSLAFLDDNNDAEYIFYKDHPHDQLDFVYPDIQPDDIVVFGSFYAVNPVIRPQVNGLLDYAKAHGAIIYYDVNFRPVHKNDIMKITPNLLESYEYADIVRGSHEDFETLYKMGDAEKVYNAEISFYCKRFIYTDGNKPVAVRDAGGFKNTYPAPETVTVSTIGAGDNFNAGFIYGLLKYGITRQTLEQGMTESQWADVMGCALAFSSECCKDIHNYISPEFGARMKADLNSERAKDEAQKQENE